MPSKSEKQLQKAVKKIVEDFELNGSDDYRRMEAAVYESTGLRLDNKSVWSLIRRVEGGTSRVSFTLDD